MHCDVLLAPVAAAFPRETPVKASPEAHCQACRPARFLASLPAHYPAAAADGERATVPGPAWRCLRRRAAGYP